MSSKKDIKTRIRAVHNTQKVTRAMKLIAIIKSKQLQNLISFAKPYNEQLSAVIKKTIQNIDFESLDADKVPILLRQSKDQSTVCLLVVSSDRGLCGPYNSALFKALFLKVQELKKKGKKIKLLLVGSKAIAYAQRVFPDFEVIAKYPNLPVIPSVEFAHEVFQLLETEYAAGNIAAVEIVYSRFLTMIKSESTFSKLVPFEVSSQAAHEEVKKVKPEVLFEPTPLQVINRLIPLYCQNEIYQAMLRGRASELAHRVNAMTAATDNASALLEQLTRTYNKARQASITQEISEIVAGAESVA
jgi:F-type H+-transporting ATPase subunit gamma